MADRFLMERLLTVKELSEVIRLSVGTIQHWVARGKIPVVRFGSRVLFRPEDIAAWIGEHSSRPVGKAKAPAVFDDGEEELFDEG
jgi:excisionase family DNA binding protein